jgi:hypothetical protein
MSLTSSSNFSKNHIVFTFRVKSSLLMKALCFFELLVIFAQRNSVMFEAIILEIVVFIGFIFSDNWERPIIHFQ